VQLAKVEVAIATAWDIVRNQLQAFLHNPPQQPACAQLFGHHPDHHCRQLIQQLIDETHWPQVIIEPQKRSQYRGTYEAYSNTLFLAKDFLVRYAQTPAVIAQVLLTCLGDFITHNRHKTAQAA
jgi:hypothetical protein